MKKSSRGFSLIELLIVIAIIGILAAIGLPAWNEYKIKGNQAAAKAFLVQIASSEAQYLIDKRSSYFGANNTAEITAQFKISPPADISSLYNFTIAINSPPPTFVVKATPLVSSGGPLWFSIDQSGARQLGSGANASGSW